MPIYEYQCEACDHQFEKIQKMSDQPLVDCPECSEPQLKKLVSAAGFQLKGNGWYVTDFKNSGKSKETKKSDKASASSSTSSSKASESVN